MRPSAWAFKYAAFDFFLFLAKIGLAKRLVAQVSVENFIRRFKHLYKQPDYPSYD